MPAQASQKRAEARGKEKKSLQGQDFLVSSFFRVLDRFFLANKNKSHTQMRTMMSDSVCLELEEKRRRGREERRLRWQFRFSSYQLR